MFKIQMGFWEKWDGEGPPTGPVAWEDDAGAAPFATEAEASADLDAMCADCGYDRNLWRVVPVEGGAA